MVCLRKGGRLVSEEVELKRAITGSDYGTNITQDIRIQHDYYTNPLIRSTASGIETRWSTTAKAVAQSPLLN